MSLPRYARLLLALASGAVLAFSFPNYNLPLFAWPAVGMLVLACFEEGPALALLYGFLHGVTFYLLSVPWIDTVMHQYGNVDSLTAAGILGLLSVVFAMFSAVFAGALALVSGKLQSGKNRLFACALSPSLWVAIEYARTHLILGGFPWNLTGYAATASLGLLQLAPITGIYGLSFLIAAYSSLIACAILAGRQIVWKITLVTTGALIVVGVGGKYFVPVAVPHHVANLVQTNFPQSEEYPANWTQVHMNELTQLERISVSAAQVSGEHPSLVVWPEVPAPFSFQDPMFTQLAQKIARESGGNFLVGIVDWRREGSGKWQASNTAVLLDSTGQRTFTYDKVHLVPFGEFVPYRRWLTFAGKLTADIGDFTPGTSFNVGQLPNGKFGVFICYEAIFPEEVREFTLHGAEVLINISNDGWFGRSAAPAQHLMMARVRAVENRRWLLRDTNNGFTASIDPYGRIVSEIPTDVRTELSAPYDFRQGLTPYVRFGDWFAWLCIIASFAFIILAFVQQPPKAAGKRKGSNING